MDAKAAAPIKAAARECARKGEGKGYLEALSDPCAYVELQ